MANFDDTKNGNGEHTNSPMITNSKLEIGDEFLKILQDNAFNGMDRGDVIDHIAKEANDIYEVIDREYSPIPIPAHRDIDNPDELCRTEEFTVVRHSLGNDEEFVTVGPSKISIVERTHGRLHMANYAVTCEDEAKRRNSGTKTKTIEENCYLLLYAVSSKEDTSY
ncbi:hypothetical protein Tco_0127626 [Tanacetum coccineum]